MESIKTAVFKTFFLIIFLLSFNLSNAHSVLNVSALGDDRPLSLSIIRQAVGWKIKSFLQGNCIGLKLLNLTGDAFKGWIIIIQDNIILREEPFSLGNGQVMYSSFSTTKKSAPYLVRIVDSAKNASFQQFITPN